MGFKLLCLGNPLLDIQANVPKEFLEKYHLKENDAVLAEPNQMGIFDELLEKYHAKYLAGGAAQNTARGAQFLLPPNQVVYVGCVGNDKAAQLLRKGNQVEGVKSHYRIDSNVPTGRCAVSISGVHRSLCTDLGAANHYKLEHLKEPETWKLVEDAKFFYIGGYHLTVCVDAILAIGKHVAESNGEKTLILNLSAPFISEFYKDQLDSVLPYVDYLIGNESEAEAYSKSHDWNTTDLEVIARKFANLPKVSKSKSRIVVITHGIDPTTVAIDNDKVDSFPVDPLPQNQIVDTNGAGDAFAGGFVAALVEGKSLQESVASGHYLASVSIRLSGPSYPPKDQ